MNLAQLQYIATRHPDTIKHWSLLASAEIPIVRANKSFPHNFALFYQALLETASRQIREWEKIHSISHSCRPGCPHCCKLPIIIGPMETIIIRTYLKNQKLNDYFTSIEKTAGLIGNEMPPPPISGTEEEIRVFMETYFSKNIHCPFLESGRCVIYPVRPIICATYYYYGDNSACRRQATPPFGLQFKDIQNWLLMKMNAFCRKRAGKFPPGLFSPDLDLLPLAVSRVAAI